MWDLGNRGVVALVSVLSGCVFLYNVWGPILVLTISLFLTIYACYSLITNDSLLSPHAFLLFDYCKHISLEVRASFESIVDHVYRYARTFWETGNRRFRELYLTQARMERRRGSHYQLSSDSYPTRRNSSKFGSISQLSPILRTTRKANADDVGSENKLYRSSDYASYEHSPFGKHVSTSMFSPNKKEFESSSLDQTVSKRGSPTYSQTRTTTHGENNMYFGAEESTWNTDIGAKPRVQTSDAKAVGAVGGPLSTSTRYNIDPRVYNDVTSPGLATRLTKYAAEASKKLTHQSRYRVGQFPKVNLQASPVPLINVKTVKTRTPVIVRVAPPDAVRYSPPGRQKIFSDLRGTDNSCPSPSVAQSLREISLKRHASGEDVTSDLAKKQRTGGIAANEFETQDETKQKRSRDESSKSEEDISPQNKTVRPTKRTKTPSCYDILNSFSSSKHVASGVKRKARDLSRSGTPDFEKHFKSLECVQSSSVQTLPEIQNINVKYRNHETMEKKDSDACSSSDRIEEDSPLKGILKTSTKSSEVNSYNRVVDAKHSSPYNGKNESTESVASIESAKLTNKLFMRAEPERNEKLRMLVEEQGNIRAKFTTDDVEEIKMEDIADMRQTSMKARLQSMFDAISGKASSKINPDVVIQAEEVNAVKAVSCPVTCATLNSSTTTTNVNTTPISTSAVALSPGTSESHSKSPKHVAFNLSNDNQETSSSSTVPISLASETKTENVASARKPDTVTGTCGITFPSESGSVPVPSASSTSTTSSNSTVVATVKFGDESTLGTATNGSSPGTFTFAAVSSNRKLPVPCTAVTTPLAAVAGSATVSSGLFEKLAGAAPKSLPVPVATAVLVPKTETNRSTPTNEGSRPIGNVSTCSNPTFGTNSVAFVSTPLNVCTSAMSFKSIASIVSAGSSPATTTAAASASLFSFGNKTSNAQTSKPEPFVVFGSMGNGTQTTNAFGSLTNSQRVSAIGNATRPSCTPPQNNPAPNIVTTAFNSDAKATIPSATFGSSVTSTFAFGVPASSAATSKPGFPFGGTSPTAASVLPGVSNATMFGATGTTTTTTNNNNSTLTFGSSPASSARQFNLNAPSIFGNSSPVSIASTTPSIASIFGTRNSHPVFGTASTLSTVGAAAGAGSFAAPKTTAPTVFGAAANIATAAGSTSANSTTIFSNTVAAGPSSGITSTTSVPIFGSSANASGSGVTGTAGNLFSNVNPTTSTSAFGATGNIFGQAKSPASDFKSATRVFGNNAATLFGSQATTTSAFGGTSVSSNPAAPGFGSANISGNATVPSFGAPSTASSGFGSLSNAQSPATPAFGNRTSVFGTENASMVAGSVFGASSSGAFGSPASNTFGGQASAFGTPNASTAAFGTGSAAVAATATATATSTATVTATATATATAAAAATTTANTANNAAASIFTFGANQKPHQPNTTFSFGGNSNNNNNNNNNNVAAPAPATAPFQFAATTSKPATGFNFSAPSATPSINFGTTSAPTFNASTPGMFSIGSGSTAPRSRNVRSRKPR